MIKHEVQAGDCMLQIAEMYGHFWEKLWNHPDNAELKRLREDPNVLAEGDIVHVPEMEPKQESAAVEKRHRYKRKGVPGKVKIRLTLDGKPRANLAYVLVIDGHSATGNTDADGFLEMDIPADAREGEICITEQGRTDIYRLDLGHLEPIDTKRGILQRIFQMGYGVDEKDASPEYADPAPDSLSDDAKDAPPAAPQEQPAENAPPYSLWERLQGRDRVPPAPPPADASPVDSPSDVAAPIDSPSQVEGEPPPPPPKKKKKKKLKRALSLEEAKFNELVMNGMQIYDDDATKPDEKDPSVLENLTQAYLKALVNGQTGSALGASAGGPPPSMLGASVGIPPADEKEECEAPSAAMTLRDIVERLGDQMDEKFAESAKLLQIIQKAFGQ